MLQELRDLADTPAGKEALAIDVGDDDSVVQVQGGVKHGRKAVAMPTAAADKNDGGGGVRASGVDR